ncbi:MAG: cyclase family protein [Pyrinomonadaceae bacterium]|nr:cyclase family protein [Pyrinomonadaceae bacterium]
MISIHLNDQIYKIDDSKPLDISIPLDFNGEQPNAYGVEKASAEPVKAGSLTGDTRLGGSCNFEQIKLIPHCNGTHTECVGHITDERISVHECLKDVFIPAVLISAEPEFAGDLKDTYAVKPETRDKLISRRSIENAFEKIKSEIADLKSFEMPKAIMVRTLPNDERKLSQTYLEDIPPYFSSEAIELLIELGVDHLLVDLPSIDRIFDEGKLSNHRKFWNIGEGSFDLSDESFLNKTITELIYVPDRINDGLFLLNLQIAPFESDASPSRPIIFPIVTL